jgi:hypothetical protein
MQLELYCIIKFKVSLFVLLSRRVNVNSYDVFTQNHGSVFVKIQLTYINSLNHTKNSFRQLWEKSKTMCVLLIKRSTQLRHSFYRPFVKIEDCSYRATE